MAYSESLAGRVRKTLSKLPKIEEKKMMGGLTFMVNGRMCVGVVGVELMCRIDPALQNESIKKKGCRVMDFTGRPMKGYVFVNENGMSTQKDLDHWINLSLDFNKQAKSSKKKKK